MIEKKEERNNNRPDNRNSRNNRNARSSRTNQNFVPKVSEYEEKVLEIKRVSKKIKGGNTIGFTVLVVVGNRNGKVGYGYDKARNVSDAIQKAIAGAKKNIVEIKLKGKTISHEVSAKYGSAKVVLRPAPEGTGIIAGGSVRIVAGLAGIKDVSSKVLGSKNKLSNVRCTIKALQKLRK
ncbi:MAG: 30S ribosomal protein S5 [Patescibacteria group bacterium]